MEINDLTFEDVLRNPEEASDLLHDYVNYELNKQNRSLRALTRLKVPVYKRSEIGDMLKFLAYRKGGKR